ncbi:TonB-dependent receptor [Thalassotalea castellviae]|uniref:TonB-dependent receptor n=1 Tax=Thalassotalea castellviae TaxID=3075612 RepID=A0ABU3A154_9GAMM|nr:TonB-dependent receptor [Thalassotalea sp. W431]MDT0603904.1 TonB-dependent receptor [Thalassotalea sp. W431]
MNYRKSLLALTVSSILTNSGVIAAEQANDESSVEKKAKTDYEVIVVTQKRVQTLRDVPVSVSAFGEDFINDFNVTNAVDLAKYTPGLNGGSDNDSYIDTIGIRGITTADYGIGGDASIGLYLDGVYQGRSGGSLSSFFDMSRVEVAKGPQGTLFGRNAASGAISMYTNEAIDDTEGSIDFGIGSDNMMEVTGVYNTTLSDNAFIRIAGYHQSQDSYIDNNVGGTLRDKEVDAFRVNFTYDGWQDSLLKVSVNYEDRDMDGGVWRSIWTEGDKRAVSSDLGEEGHDIAEVFATTVDFTHEFDSVTFFSQTAIKSNEWNYLEDYDGTAMPLGNYSQNDDNEYMSQEFRITSNTDSDIFWFIGVNVYEEKVKSYFYNGYDDDAFCAQLPNLEEWEQPLDSHTSQPENYYTDCHEFMVDGWFGLDPVYDAEIIAELVEYGEIPAPGAGVKGMREEVFARGTNSGYGIYGDVTWSMSKATDITIGGRYSYDKKEFALNLPEPDGWLGHYWLVGGHTDGEWLDAEQDWSEFTPRVALSHQLNEDVNLYANYSRGYKAGGYNTFAFNLDYKDWTGWDVDEEWFSGEPDGVIDEIDEGFWLSELYGGAIPQGSELASFEPEIVDSYEIGLKGDFFDNSVKVNIGAYFYDYQDFQGQFAQNGGAVIKNIGQAEGKGVEFDVTYLPTDNLRLFIATAIQDSEVKEGEGLSGESLVGKKLSTPDVTFSFLGSYYWASEDDYDFTAQLSYTWQSETMGEEFMNGSEIYALDSYGLIGAQFSVEKNRWKLSAYIDNLTDEEYYDASVADTGISNFGIGRGINGGINVKYSF